MPVPLLLEDKGEMLVAVEDNKEGEFKPAFYREKLADNWKDGFISGDDPRRLYQPLQNPLAKEVYAGAPYLARLQSGEVLLSYQSTLNRNRRWNQSSMMVEIGDDAGNLFNRRSVPFAIPLEKSGLWNSLAIINTDTPVAVTSTNAFSPNSTETWMIKGHVIPEFSIPQGKARVDGDLNDNCWQGNWPYFIGQNSETQMKATLCSDTHFLYLAVKVFDLKVAESRDGIIFQLDTKRKGYEKTHSGIYAFHMGSNGSLKIMEGNNGNWEETKKSKVKLAVNQNEDFYSIELAVPLKTYKLSEKTGVNFILKDENEAGYYYEESIPSNEPEQPFTWCTVHYNKMK